MRALVFGIFSLFISATSYANTLDCHAQVLRTVCGSGEIKLTIDLDKGTYYAKYGAVACWGADIIDKGLIKEITGSYPFSHDDTYKLFKKGVEEEKVEIATLVVQGDHLSNGINEKPALLELEKSSFGGHILYRQQFNLICNQ